MCPLDYVWDPGHFDDAAKEHGPRIDIREHNFLDRAELPSTVKVAPVSVSLQICLLLQMLQREL